MLRRQVTNCVRSALGQAGGPRLAHNETQWVKPMTLDLPSLGNEGRRRKVTVLPGDGVGPEVVSAAQEVIAATGES